MAYRRLFMPHEDYTVVVPIHLGGDERLEIGATVNRETFSLVVLQHWYRCQMIGVKGCEWAKARAEAHQRRSATKTITVTPGVSVPVPTVRPVKPKLDVVKGKKGWYSIMVDGVEVDNVRGAGAVRKWKENNGYA